MGHGQAVQHADRTATRHRLVGLGRIGHRLFGDQRDDGVDLRIHAFDLREMRGHHLAGRHLLPRQPRGQLDGAHLAQLRPLRQLRRAACRRAQHLMECRVDAPAAIVAPKRRRLMRASGLRGSTDSGRSGSLTRPNLATHRDALPTAASDEAMTQRRWGLTGAR